MTAVLKADKKSSEYMKSYQIQSERNAKSLFKYEVDRRNKFYNLIVMQNFVGSARNKGIIYDQFYKYFNVFFILDVNFNQIIVG